MAGLYRFGGTVPLASASPHLRKVAHFSWEDGKGGNEGTCISRCLIIESLELRCGVCHVATLGRECSGMALLRLSEAFLAAYCNVVHPETSSSSYEASYVILHRDPSLVYWLGTVYSRHQSKLSPAFQLLSSSIVVCSQGIAWTVVTMAAAAGRRIGSCRFEFPILRKFAMLDRPGGRPPPQSLVGGSVAMGFLSDE